MTKADVRRIAEQIDSNDVISFLLARVNLTDMERRIAFCRIIRGLSQEETAEELDVSPRNLQRIDRKMYDKIIRNWSALDFLVKYLN